MKALFVTLLLFACATHVYARAVKYWYPDELTDKSTLVCDGQVISVTPHFQSCLSNMRLYSSAIKVLAILKGSAPDTIEFCYYRYDPWNPFMHFNDPINVGLTKGDKCRFYLQKDSRDDIYFGCLQGQGDDGQSVGPILIPDSAEEAKIRFSELSRKQMNAEHAFQAALVITDKPGYKEARDDVVSRLLKLVLDCESLKHADVDQKKVEAAEDGFIAELAQWKDWLFSESKDTAAFDKDVNDNLPYPAIREYVIKRMIIEWDRKH